MVCAEGNAMQSRKAVRAGISVSLLLGFFLTSSLASGQSIDGLHWGTAIDGLQMSISTIDSSTVNVPQFQLAFWNAGEQDVTLNLGMMLANGKAQLPNKIALRFTDASGMTRKLDFFDKRYPAIAGRIDDYVVPLRAGSIYTLKISLDQFWSPATKEFDLKLSAGQYRISAQFEGGGAVAPSLDMPGIKLMNFWIGKLQSNTLLVAGR